MKKKYFGEKINQVDQALNKRNKIILKLGTYRLTTFLVMVVSLIEGIYAKSVLGFSLAILMLIGFIGLVKKYHQEQQALVYDQAKKKVLERYLLRLEDSQEGWKGFTENGSQYLQEIDTKSKDLDLLGRSSLYQYISVCHTPYGKQGLAQALSKGCPSNQKITERQEAVKEFIEDEAFAIDIQTISQLMAEKKEREFETKEFTKFIEEVEKRKRYISPLMGTLSYIIPFMTLFALLSALFNIQAVIAYGVACVGILVQMWIGFIYSKESEAVLGPVYAFTKNLCFYQAFLEAIESKTFKSKYLVHLQAEIKSCGGAVAGLKALRGLSGAIDVRHSGMLYFIVMSLLMWDVHCKDALYKWSQQYGLEIRKWLTIVGEIEVLLSLAVVGQIKEEYCYPEIVESDQPQIQFKALAHPLIQEEKVVSNSFALHAATCVITGSNMSGKTTFLRSIGTNLSLAYAGGVVVAKAFSASRMQVFTSMRVEDRVDQGISTFYAEILRIKEMVHYSEKKQPMLILIDEIFKGTNSVDRILGAQETIKRLGKPWVNIMVSTHDFELCHLEREGNRKMMNYHFEEHYKDDHILFDYQLKEGQSKTTNAQYLLKMAGIIEE